MTPGSAGRRGSLVASAGLCCSPGGNPRVRGPLLPRTHSGPAPCQGVRSSALRAPTVHGPSWVGCRGGNPGVSRLSLASNKGRWLRVLSSHSAPGYAQKCQRLWDPSLSPLKSEGRVGEPGGFLSPKFQGAPDPRHLSTSRLQTAWLGVPRVLRPTPPPLFPHLGHRPGLPLGPTRAPRAPLPPAPPPWAHGLAEGLLQNFPVPTRPCCDAGSVQVNSFPPGKFRSWAKKRTRGQERQKP